MDWSKREGGFIMALSDARKKANRKWDEKNREHKIYLSWRSRAKSFIRKAATLDDLNEIKELVDQRIEELSKGND